MFGKLGRIQKRNRNIRCYIKTSIVVFPKAFMVLLGTFTVVNIACKLRLRRPHIRGFNTLIDALLSKRNRIVWPLIWTLK